MQEWQVFQALLERAGVCEVCVWVQVMGSSGTQECSNTQLRRK
jgi:hypothetical protein